MLDLCRKNDGLVTDESTTNVENCLLEEVELSSPEFDAISILCYELVNDGNVGNRGNKTLVSTVKLYFLNLSKNGI